MKVKQYFEELSNAVHLNEHVLIRAHNTDGTRKWVNYKTRIYSVESAGTIVVIFDGSGTLLRLERDMIKLMR